MIWEETLMYMKDKDIADVLESCANTLKGLNAETPGESLLRDIASVAEALDELVENLREW